MRRYINPVKEGQQEQSGSFEKVEIFRSSS